jgi:hypothetical protein
MTKLLAATALALSVFATVPVHAEEQQRFLPYSVTDSFFVIDGAIRPMTADACRNYRYSFKEESYVLCIPAHIAYTHHLHEHMGRDGWYGDQFGPKDLRLAEGARRFHWRESLTKDRGRFFISPSLVTCFHITASITPDQWLSGPRCGGVALAACRIHPSPKVEGHQLVNLLDGFLCAFTSERGPQRLGDCGVTEGSDK